MKKTLAILGTIVLVLVLLTTVAKAATTQDVIDFLSQPHKFGNTTKQISAGKKKSLEQFLTVDRPITETEANAILTNAKAAIAVMNNAGTADLEKLSKADYAQVKSYVEQTEAALGDVEFKIDTKNNIVVPYVNGVAKAPLPYGDDLANTGDNYTAYIVASVLAIFAVATITLVKKNTVNA